MAVSRVGPNGSRPQPAQVSMRQSLLSLDGWHPQFFTQYTSQFHKLRLVRMAGGEIPWKKISSIRRFGSPMSGRICYSIQLSIRHKALGRILRVEPDLSLKEGEDENRGGGWFDLVALQSCDSWNWKGEGGGRRCWSETLYVNCNYRIGTRLPLPYIIFRNYP